MSNEFDKKIKELEQLQQKLKESQFMQGPLNSFITEMLDKNLRCFQKYYPAIVQKFKKFHLFNYKLVCFKDSEPNVLNLKTGSLLYKNDPYQDTKSQVDDCVSGKSTIRMRYSPSIYNDLFEQFSFKCCNELAKNVIELTKDKEPFKYVPDAVPNVILIGGGLGFPITEIYSHTSAINFFYIEPDEELFYCSLCVFDWEPILNHIADNGYDLRFIIGQDVENTISALEKFYLDDYPYVLGYQVILQHYKSKTCDEILEQLKISSEKVAVRLGQFDDKMFGIANELNNLSNYNVLSKDPLPSKFKDIPVLVVGNGPSLDDDLDTIKSIQNNCLIIACGTAFNSLLKYGIQPDIYVALERITSVADSLKEIISMYDFSKTLCITPDVVHPKTLELFPNNLLFFKVGESLLDNLPISYVSLFNKYLYCECLGPLVSNCGLSLALSLGFRDVWMVGIDNGSTKDYGHSKYSSYYDNEGNLRPECNNMLLDTMDLVAKGNFKDKVKTNFMFLNSISFMEKLISYHQLAKVKNSSDGAFVNGTTPLHLRELVINKNLNFSKSTVINELVNNSKKMNIEASILEKIKNEKAFNELVNNIDLKINDFLLEADMKEDVLKLFNWVMKYLIDSDDVYRISKSLLKGTLASMFSDVISLIYTLDDEDIITKTKFLINVIKKFLNGAKVLYSHMDEYIQGSHILFQNEINKYS